jgi:hypothetical protein
VSALVTQVEQDVSLLRDEPIVLGMTLENLGSIAVRLRARAYPSPPIPKPPRPAVVARFELRGLHHFRAG